MLFAFVTLVSKILIILSVIGLLFNWIRGGIDEGSAVLRFLPKKFSSVKLIGVFFIGLIILSLNSIFFYAEPGMSYLVQYPWGSQNSVLKPGFHPRWFGEVIPFKKYLTIAFVDPKGNNDSFSGTAPIQEIRFHDSVTATMKMTARFEMPNDEARFLPMAVAYRSQENLIYSTLIPTMQEAMRNAGRMYAAQEYIGGKGGDFENAVLDQIRNGIFLLDIQEETTYAGKEKISDDEDRTIQQDQTMRVYVRKRLGPDGQELRKDGGDTPLKKFGITLIQANVQDVDPDPGFKKKLLEQREAAAQVAIERQNARKEEERKKRIIAQGEAEKAEKRIELEKAQIERVIAAETKAKEAQQEQNRRVTMADTLKKESVIEKERREIELQTAKLEAQRIEALAEAESNKRRKLMQADNALEKRLEAFVEVSKAYADALQDKQLVPGVVISSGGKGGGQPNATDLISLLTAKAANDLGVAVTAGQQAALSPAVSQ
jgi:regulator of protease activity HflC (stomatin/prohibitin superfamily)